MKTEDEARKMWCPFSMAEGQGAAASHNRPDMSYNCIASECMAWRWAEDVYEYRYVQTGRKQEVAAPEGDGWEECDFERDDFIDTYKFRRKKDAPRGYCGLAGKHD